MVDPNPYAPPKARVEGARAIGPESGALGPLYSVSQIFVATFIGSPLAGAWLMMKNHDALGHDGESARVRWTGVGATLLLLVASFLLPDKFPNSILPLAAAFGFRAYAEHELGPAIAHHQAAGGALFSWWRVVGLGLLWALIVLVVFGSALFALTSAGIIDP